MMNCLERGSLQRVTASTLMNDSSSRSHAIFTIFIEQHTLEESSIDQNSYITAKFHFVDLAVFL